MSAACCIVVRSPRCCVSGPASHIWAPTAVVLTTGRVGKRGAYSSTAPVLGCLPKGMQGAEIHDQDEKRASVQLPADVC